MATLHITDENFRETYTNNDIVILDFWAPWCGPCQMFGPIFEAASDQYDDVVFGKINTEEETKLAMYFGIRSIPTIVVLRSGVKVFEQPGALGEQDLHQLIAAVKQIDMEAELARLEAEEDKA
ncbi:MAG: thioredoxin [Bdellovibrionales bacterium]|nr:thioredoxin [Bdellovibrionales bacterium]